MHAGKPHPLPRPGRHYPGTKKALPGPGTPPEQSMLGDTVNERAVRILLEYNLVFSKKRRLPIDINDNVKIHSSRMLSRDKDERHGV